MTTSEAALRPRGSFASEVLKTTVLPVAIGVAMLAALSQVQVGGPVPMTLQTLAVFLNVGLLGTRRATAAVCSYLALGLLGAPVFAGFTGGAAHLLGLTGGYIVGFIPATLVAGAIIGRFGKRALAMAVAMVAGLAVCYAFGTAWFMVASGAALTGEGLGSTLALCVTPFVAPDLVKIALAVGIIGTIGAIRHKHAGGAF